MKALDEAEQQARRKSFEALLVKYYNKDRAGTGGTANGCQVIQLNNVYTFIGCVCSFPISCLSCSISLQTYLLLLVDALQYVGHTH
jgi:hypothetical protein